MFRPRKSTGSQMADIMTDVSQSALYLDVTDAAQDAQLRGQFAVQLGYPVRKVSPNHIRLRMVEGSEGGYTTAVLRSPIAKPNE